MPVLLYCSSSTYPRVAGLHDPDKRRVVVTALSTEAISFASFQSTFPPLPKKGSMRGTVSGLLSRSSKH